MAVRNLSSKLNFYIAGAAMALTLCSCSANSAMDSGSLKPSSDQIAKGSDNEACDGEIFIYYNAAKHPITLERVLKLLKEKSTYRCTMSEWQLEHIHIPIVRVETAMPIMIMNDSAPDVLQEMSDLAKDQALSKEESEFIRTCTARLQISGAGNLIVEKRNGFAIYREPKYAPRAKDTMDVVRILMTAVDGIGSCSTDGRWIRK